jgi:hypothetical protein
LVHHGADRIEIRSGREPFGKALLGRHIRHRADDALVDAALGPDVHHQPEVEQHHAPARRDQRVRGLEVTMQVAGSVQRAYALDQLREGRAEPVFVVPQRSRLRAAVPVDLHRVGVGIGALIAPARAHVI